MWLLLTNFLTFSMAAVFRSAVIKFVIFTAVVLLIAALVLIVFNYLANIDIFGLNNLLRNLPDGLLYFLTVFQFHLGVPMMLGAFLTRFAIRRVPVIG